MPNVSHRRFLALVLAVGVAAAAVAAFADRGRAAAGDAGAAEQRTIVCANYRIAAVDDDSHRAALYAIQKRAVKSKIIGSVRVDYLSIPGLIQATGSDQYDAVETSLPGVVNARVRGRLDLRVLYIALAHTGGGIKTYVRRESNIRTVRDLVGKTVGVPSLGSTAIVEARIVYKERYGVDSAVRGGDIRFVELDPQTLLNAVKQGQVDAALLWHYAGWLASRDRALRILNHVDRDYKAETGQWPVGAAFVVTGKHLAEKGACDREFQRMLIASTNFARKRTRFVANKISRDTKIPAAFIRYWWNGKSYKFGGVDTTWRKMAQTLYDAAHRNGDLPIRLDLDSIFVHYGRR